MPSHNSWHRALCSISVNSSFRSCHYKCRSYFNIYLRLRPGQLFSSMQWTVKVWFIIVLFISSVNHAYVFVWGCLWSQVTSVIAHMSICRLVRHLPMRNFLLIFCKPQLHSSMHLGELVDRTLEIVFRFDEMHLPSIAWKITFLKI